MVLHVLVTAGGTTESIDAVRTIRSLEFESAESTEIPVLLHEEISNISRGRFPAEVAFALSRLGSPALPIEVTLLGNKELWDELSRSAIPDNLRLRSFRSFRDLGDALRDEVGSMKPNLILMGAAVSDYTPVGVEGKIASDKDEIVIRLTRNPKLLDSLRSLTGKRSVLVGFKLLAGVSDERLIEVSHGQLVRSDTDFTIGNDATRIDWKRGWHPIVFVGPEGLLWQMEDFRKNVAERLAHELVMLTSARMTGE